MVAVGFSDRRLGIDIEKLQSPAQSEDLLFLIRPLYMAAADRCTGSDRQIEATAAST